MADIVNAGQPAGGTAGFVPANYDFVIYKGDYFQLPITLKDSSGTAMNLTGYTPKSTLKTSYDDPGGIDFVCTVTDAVNGKVTLFLSSATTTNLLPGTYIYDFQVTSNVGETRTYLTGDVTVQNEVTV